MNCAGVSLEPAAPMTRDAWLQARLAEIDRQGLSRSRRRLNSPQQAVVQVDGQTLVNFCSNDYLGLASDPRVVAALQTGAGRWGVGAGAAHLVSGHSGAHHALEEALAEFTGRPRAILFSTGYMANMGVITALLGRGDMLFADRLNHASLVDGARLSGARFLRYPHVDVAALDARLASARSGSTLLVSDGVFSMDGDLAPVAALAERADAHGAWLMIDDAHGLGVIGATGGGVLEVAGLSTAQVPILVGTLGKAFGTFGAFVAGGEDMIEYLIQRARTYLFTTALPPAIAAATRTAVDLVRAEGWRRDRLAELIQRFRSGAEQLGLALMPSSTPIQPLLIGDNQAAVRASAGLQAAGFWVGAIRPPTVPAGTARLRVTLTATHSEAQVDGLLAALAGLDLPRRTS